MEVLDLVFASILIMFSMLSLVFNSALIFIILKTKVLHTCTNSFVLSLAFSEMMIAFVILPVHSASRIAQGWVFNDGICKCVAFLNTVGRCSSMMSLMFLSIDRCIAVWKPLKYSSIVTSQTSAIMIGYLWCQSIIFGLLPLVNIGFYQFNNEQYLCIYDVLSDSTFAIVRFIIALFVPYLIIITCLVKILLEARSRHSIFALATIPLRLNGLGPVNFNTRTLKAMKSLFCIVLAYTFLCLPDSIMNIVKLLNKQYLIQVHKVVYILVTLLSSSCCFVTPVIITLFNKKYKQKLKEFKTCCSCKNKVVPSRSHLEDFSVTSGLHTLLGTTLIFNIQMEKRNTSVSLSTSSTYDPSVVRNSVDLRTRFSGMSSVAIQEEQI